MSIKKQYLKNKAICKVTFRMTRTGDTPAKTIHLAGDFNNWKPESNPMTRLKNGSFKTVLSLATGREYQFRYLVNSELWKNDEKADKYTLNPYGDAENCVVSI